MALKTCLEALELATRSRGEGEPEGGGLIRYGFEFWKKKLGIFGLCIKNVWF